MPRSSIKVLIDWFLIDWRLWFCLMKMFSIICEIALGNRHSAAITYWSFGSRTFDHRTFDHRMFDHRLITGRLVTADVWSSDDWWPDELSRAFDYTRAQSKCVETTLRLYDSGDQTLFKMVTNRPVINLPVIKLSVIKRPVIKRPQTKFLLLHKNDLLVRWI